MKWKIKLSILPLTLSVIFLFFLGTMLLFAEEAAPKYTPLIGIPGLTDDAGLNENTSLPVYINRVYMLLIVVGAMIAVIKIALAGAKYSLSGVVTDKSEAKNDIMGVLLGLVLLLIPFIVLNTIYPGLTNLNILQPGSGNVTGPRQNNSHSNVDSTQGLSTADSVARLSCFRSGKEYNATTKNCASETKTGTERDALCIYGGGLMENGTCVSKVRQDLTFTTRIGNQLPVDAWSRNCSANRTQLRSYVYGEFTTLMCVEN